MRPALPLLALVLAGCAAAPVPPGLATALHFAPPMELPGSALSAEPNFAAGPDGNLWLIGVGSVVRDPNVARGEVSLWHSGDFGANWEVLREPANQDASKQAPFCSCDTDVDYAQDGTLYITDFWVTQGGNGFVVEASHDGGRTWDPGNFVTTQSVPAGNDRQYIAAGLDPGEVFLSFNGGGLGGVVPAPLPVPLPGLPVSGGGLQLWRSTDSGRVFQLVATPYEGGGAFIAKLRVGPDGTLYYPWVEVDPGASDGWTAPGTVVVATSTDHGSTFERHEVAAIPNGVGGLWPLEVDVGPDNVAHAVWMERGADWVGSQLWYGSSRDGAATWSAPVRVGWTSGTAVLPWVAHAGAGRAVVAFYGNDTALVPLEAPEDARWYAWALTIDAATGASTQPVQVAPWPVKVGTFCPQGASCPEDRELLDYPAVIWRDGWANVAFAVSTLDEGAGPPRAAAEEPRGGHSTAAKVWAGRAALP